MRRRQIEISVTEIEARDLRDLEAVAAISGFASEDVRRFCELGALSPAGTGPNGVFYFDDTAVWKLRAVVDLLDAGSVDRHGAAVMLELLERLHETERQLSLLRERL